MSCHPASLDAVSRSARRDAIVGASFVRVDLDDGSAYYLGDVGGSFVAVGFLRTSVKVAFRYRFKSAAARDDYVGQWERALTKRAAEARERHVERVSARHPFMRGSILYAVWGVEQTNVDYYEVTRVVSDKTIEIRLIASETEESGERTGWAMPIPGAYRGEPMVKRWNPRGVALGGRQIAKAWDGSRKNYNTYG